MEDSKEQKEIVKQIKKDLETTPGSKKVSFVRPCRKHEELKDMVLEAIEEHKQVKTLLREMDELAKASDKAKLKVLMTNVEHHAEEEEEGKMFPKVRELLDKAALETLGQELEAAKGHKSKAA